jgi:hypothetical protein
MLPLVRTHNRRLLVVCFFKVVAWFSTSVLPPISVAWEWTRNKLWVASPPTWWAGFSLISDGKEYAMGMFLTVASGMFLMVYSFSWTGVPNFGFVTKCVRVVLFMSALVVMFGSASWVLVYKPEDEAWSNFFKKPKAAKIMDEVGEYRRLEDFFKKYGIPTQPDRVVTRSPVNPPVEPPVNSAAPRGADLRIDFFGRDVLKYSLVVCFKQSVVYSACPGPA